MNEIDIRLNQLSYSSLLTLHACPRKFQLDRLQAPREEGDDLSSSVTFAFGHAVGQGIQSAMESKTESQVLMDMFLIWEANLLAENEKQKKSFWSAVIAVQKFMAMRTQGYLEDWELVYIDGKPACELSFLIHMPDGFKLRGFVDAVLRNKLTNEIMVLELKTTSSYAVNSATYKNSAQAIGYSVVLDHLFPELSSYEVLYLIYKTKDKEYEQLQFTKSYFQRALWIRELLLDIEVIKMYEEAGIYPMRGESCYNYFRECEYIYTCMLSTDKLTDSITEEQAQKILQGHDTYQIHITLNDLIVSQLSKGH